MNKLFILLFLFYFSLLIYLPLLYVPVKFIDVDVIAGYSNGVNIIRDIPYFFSTNHPFYVYFLRYVLSGDLGMRFLSLLGVLSFPLIVYILSKDIYVSLFLLTYPNYYSWSMLLGTESLFIPLLFLFAYFIKKELWIHAFIISLFSVLVREVGIFMLLIFLIYKNYWIGYFPIIIALFYKTGVYFGGNNVWIFPNYYGLLFLIILLSFLSFKFFNRRHNLFLFGFMLINVLFNLFFFNGLFRYYLPSVIIFFYLSFYSLRVFVRKDFYAFFLSILIFINLIYDFYYLEIIFFNNGLLTF